MSPRSQGPDMVDTLTYLRIRSKLRRQATAGDDLAGTAGALGQNAAQDARFARQILLGVAMLSTAVVSIGWWLHKPAEQVLTSIPPTKQATTSAPEVPHSEAKLNTEVPRRRIRRRRPAAISEPREFTAAGVSPVQAPVAPSTAAPSDPTPSQQDASWTPTSYESGTPPDPLNALPPSPDTDSGDGTAPVVDPQALYAPNSAQPTDADSAQSVPPSVDFTTGLTQ